MLKEFLREDGIYIVVIGLILAVLIAVGIVWWELITGKSLLDVIWREHGEVQNTNKKK